ncbi:microcin C transport system substrate-binding protein [Mesorhizobium sp. J18]|uniref:extracellular solute-binding protein n=1 Tax=Mesorhizobium sp. J18 TaxID=935263 RepID=UPI001199EE6A|nr:extracellular solute-binding protein [Mesorhizobium sp. J18]TWG92336.1 microcin C transport system substrate-binding protein [Mesorhizobium sp. J18]
MARVFRDATKKLAFAAIVIAGGVCFAAAQQSGAGQAPTVQEAATTPPPVGQDGGNDAEADGTDTRQWRISSSLIDPDIETQAFEHYDYVNPEAPKGGTLNSSTIGTFDSFNPFVVRGTPAAGLSGFGGILYDTLMQQSTDEAGTSHALIAEAFTYPEDYSSATYRLNPEARWHDGKPITAEDVVWSFNVLKKQSPLYTQYYANVTEAVAVSDREVEFRFNQTGNRELPHIMGDLAVLPKHWWEGTDSSGRKRDISQPTLEPPLGSGPYAIESFKPGSEIVWKRVEDYWAADLPVNVGRYNFDRRRYVYFQDDNAAWQAFTKGGFEDIRMENRSQRWATGYNFPAFEAKDVLKAEFETNSGEPMQGFVMNTRRPQFQDRRVREALTLAFDFESMNRTLFYNSYTRTDSYFEGSELASGGLPEGLELEILNTVKDKVPEEVFTEEFKLPVYDKPEAARDYLRRAHQLLSEAGWNLPPDPSLWQRFAAWIGFGEDLPDERFRINEEGKRFTIEFLGNDPTANRVTAPYIENLRRLGIDASLRIVDTNQYINRYRNFQFDMLTTVLQQSQSPGNEQRDFWSSEAADTPGSRNLAGIKNEAIDALIERVIYAKDREELVAATHALDRVLLWNYYMIPQWHLPEIWVAYWNKFGIPDGQPSYIGVDIESWWVDEEKEKALARKYGGRN